MFVFEALDAAHGDCFLLHFDDAGRRRLWLVDGGPGPTYRERLAPRLEQLRGDGPLRIDLALITHIDDDHIAGVLALLRRESRLVLDERKPGTVEIRDAWFNGFGSIVSEHGRAADVVSPDASGPLPHGAFAEVASVPQGNELLRTLADLRIPVNAAASGAAVSAPATFAGMAGAKVTVLAPSLTRLNALRAKWRKAEAKPRSDTQAAEVAGLFREDLDTSVPNLSSIVALVEADGKRILLTGDARGDDIVAGWEAARPGDTTPYLLDVMKVPHHGSDRGITERFLRLFPARHYVISANGRDDNPDPKVLEQIAVTQEGRDCTIHVTNDLPRIRRKMEELQARPGCRIAYRPRNAESDPLSLKIQL